MTRTNKTMKFKDFLIIGLLPMAINFAHGESLPTYTLEDFIITSSPLSLTGTEITQSATVIDDEKLADVNADTIAATLSLQPGISQTYYGPNANRPIIRGLDGFRVSVLENGLNAFDLSATSNDHAVGINPLLIDRIEVLRGSSTLVHGSHSIGGVINVFDNSIPSLWKNTDLTNEFKIRFSSVNDGKNFGGIVFEQIGDIVFQINGSKVNTSDYEAPAFELHHDEHAHEVQYAVLEAEDDGSLHLHVEELEEDHAEANTTHNDEEFFETVENTHSETRTFGFGGSISNSRGYNGLSYSNYTTSYGAPNHESSIFDIKREKTAFESFRELDSGYFDNVEFSLVYGDYSHVEDGGHEEGDSVVLYEYHEDEGEFEEAEDHGHEDHHAKFIKKGIDSKLVFTKQTDNNSSALSLCFSDIDMKIDGEESYLAAMNHYASQNAHNESLGTLVESVNPSISNDSAKAYGIGFLHKTQVSEELSINGGVRYEFLSRDYDATEREADPHPQVASSDSEEANIDRDDNSINASIGFVLKKSESLSFSGNLHYSERIPETSELFSSGAHHATESFEIGNKDLENEESIGVEFAITNDQGAFKQKLSLFYNDYENFIFQSDTGFKTGTNQWIKAEDDPLVSEEPFDELVENNVVQIDGDYYIKPEYESLDIRQYKGVKANIYGLEYEFAYQLTPNSSIKGFADSITGKNETDNIALPRIPPYRIGIGYYANIDDYRFNINAVRHGQQDNLANGEEVTDSYTLINARLGFSPSGDGNSELYIKVNNLSDELAYVHTSFLKESAPLPGRSFEIGYNLTF